MRAPHYRYCSPTLPAHATIELYLPGRWSARSAVEPHISPPLWVVASSVALTLAIYSHVRPQADREAAERIAALIDS
jgi:hypothetical protein